MNKLHRSGTANWQVNEAVIDLLRETVDPSMTTLETGAGHSTLAFAELGSAHTAVTCQAAEVAAIQAEMDNRGIDGSRVTFEVGYSQDVLPGLHGSLDVALIDGGHGFPIPQVDFTYIAPRLAVGGILIIDDIDLWTGKILVEFLRQEPGWQCLKRLRGRTAVFRTTAPVKLNEWCNQPWVSHKSRWPQLRRKLGNAIGMMARGDLRALRAKWAHERALNPPSEHAEPRQR